MAEEKISIYGELHLWSDQPPAKLREALVAAMSEPWKHDIAAEEAMRDSAVGSNDDTIVAQCQERKKYAIPAARLFLMETPHGYKVSNIVPHKQGALTIGEYNRILTAFAEQVAEPAAQKADFEVKLSVAPEGLDDWTSEAAAKALRAFSVAANKSAAAGHPRDRERWFAFLAASHEADRRLSTEQLLRWLEEVEHWPTEVAHALTGEYERSLNLLDFVAARG